MVLTAQQLIEDPQELRPHVVLLGAGASRAAFPNGDLNGYRLPVMDDLVSTLGLQPLINEACPDIGDNRNFENVYSHLSSKPKYKKIVKKLEGRIRKYFSELALPEQVTIYDRLLLSLRPRDAVFTFNWDPFLFDAYQRNCDAVQLPEIFFLHGNVRIGACCTHDSWGSKDAKCSVCHQPFGTVPLLYPIRQKDRLANDYTRRNWEAAEALFAGAFTLTIFGYGAPDSDMDAVDLLRQAWFNRSTRTFEHIEIIDTASSELLHKRWETFTPTYHFRTVTDFEHSRIARWPRRSCEALLYSMTQGLPCEDFLLPSTGSVVELPACAANIAHQEQ